MMGCNPVKEDLTVVGEYIQRFNDLTDQDLPCGAIYQSRGLETHVKRHHASEIDLINHIPTVIKNPEYIGKHPTEPNSIELIKQIDKNAMVCIKLDIKENYLYVASVFSISSGKLNNRLNSGRLQKY